MRLTMLFRHCTLNVKLQLFLSYCCSFYSCALWCKFKKASLNRIFKAHNRILKSLLNAQGRCSISSLFVSNNVSNFTVTRRRLINSLYKRVYSCQNSIVNLIYNTSQFASSLLLMCWKNNLF